MSLDPKKLNAHVTNLEIWLLLAGGFVVGRWPSWWSLIGLFVAGILIERLWRPHCGLDQWPNPHGRYYREWLTKNSTGDYYAWLAAKMGGREPWATWKRLARQLNV